MEQRLKERLTGAILLVLLVVILVPAMFRGDRSGVPEGSLATVAGAQQVYTIDLKGAPPSGPEATAVASAPAALPAESPTAPDEAQGAAQPRSSAATTSQGAAVPSPPAAAAPAREPVSVQPRKPAETPAATAKPAPKATAAAAGRGFAVQVGSFSRRENASTMVRQAARKGVQLVVAGPDDRGFFRVRSPVVRTRQEAVSLQQKLQSQGFKGSVGAVN